jgi:hypothetical protein
MVAVCATAVARRATRIGAKVEPAASASALVHETPIQVQPAPPAEAIATPAGRLSATVTEPSVEAIAPPFSTRRLTADCACVNTRFRRGLGGGVRHIRKPLPPEDPVLGT